MIQLAPIRSILCLCVLALLCSPRALQAGGPASYHGFYLLSFDRYGSLSSRYERDLAIDELQANRRVRRIFIVSYGWANDGESSFGAYQELIGALRANVDKLAPPEAVAIFGIGWDSSQSGFRKLFNDLLPFPLVADSLAMIPDALLFPFSFWSKAAMADRIGYGGLRGVLNQIFGEVYPEGEPHPEIFLIGHSFGTRILSGLMKEDLGFFAVRAEEFMSAKHVKGAVMLQPALVADNLPRDPHYPLLVTQSRHDHANGMLFPAANLLINTYSFTTFEALLQNRAFGTLEQVVGTASSTVSRAGGLVAKIVVPGRASEPEATPEEAREDPEQGPGAFSGLPVRAYRATRRSLAELLSLPAAFLFSAIMTPASYLFDQVLSIARHPVDHVMDTLAQIPVVEIPVDGLSRALGREIPWGSRGKGFFNLGPLNEAMGRLATPTIRSVTVPRQYTPEELHEIAERGEGCGLPRCQGAILVDASRIVSRGVFGDLERPLLDYTVGWLDLIGSHTDYTNPEVVSLMRLVIPDLE